MNIIAATVFDTQRLIIQLYDHCLTTFQHSLRVGDMLYGFANFLGMENTKEIYLLGNLHDIGKLQIPSSLLNKNNRLTFEEFEEMKKHTLYGQQLVKSIPELPDEFSNYILYHHENWDSTGYYGIKGEEIPLLSRMIRIVDSYDTMLYGRPYQKSKSQNEVISEIYSLSNQHYDPVLTKTFSKFLFTKYQVKVNYGT